MSRFHLVVFKFQQISPFLNNFDRIRNFAPEQDKI
jgi:hypothetical protein